MARKKSAPTHYKIPIAHLQGLMATRALGLVREYFNKSFEVVSNDASLDQVQREYSKLAITLEEREMTYAFLCLSCDMYPTDELKKSVKELENELRTLKEGKDILEAALVQQYQAEQAGAGEDMEVPKDLPVYDMDALLQGMTPEMFESDIPPWYPVGNEFPNGYNSPEELAWLEDIRNRLPEQPDDSRVYRVEKDETGDIVLEPLVPSGYDIEVEEGEPPI